MQSRILGQIKTVNLYFKSLYILWNQDLFRVLDNRFPTSCCGAQGQLFQSSCGRQSPCWHTPAEPRAAQLQNTDNIDPHSVFCYIFMFAYHFLIEAVDNIVCWSLDSVYYCLFVYGLTSYFWDWMMKIPVSSQ